MQPLHQENVPVKAKLGTRYFLCRKWQHFKLFQSTETVLVLKQRKCPVRAQNPLQLLRGIQPHCSSTVPPIPKCSRAPWEPPGDTSLHQKAPHGVISGGFFGRLPEKAQTPQVELQGNKEETDGMKELPKNFPSLWPQLFANHFSFQNELFPWAVA